MANEVWTTVVIDGVEYWEVNCKARMAKESDPDREVLILVATPAGGHAALGPLVQGDPGKHTIIDDEITFTPLAPGDPTEDYAYWTVLTPGSDTVSQVVKLSLGLHTGEDGEDGSTSIDMDSVTGTPVVGKSLYVNSDATGFEYAYPKVGGMHWPATGATEASAASAGVTLHTIAWAPNTYRTNVRVHVNAGTLVNGSTNDVQVDLVARLNAADGPVIGRCKGVNGTNNQLTLVSGPDAGASADTNKVTAGNGATVYIRAEKQGGTATFTTSNTRASVEVIAV